MEARLVQIKVQLMEHIIYQRFFWELRESSHNTFCGVTLEEILRSLWVHLIATQMKLKVIPCQNIKSSWLAIHIYQYLFIVKSINPIISYLTKWNTFTGCLRDHRVQLFFFVIDKYVLSKHWCDKYKFDGAHHTATSRTVFTKIAAS